jgi:hypothetical protein
MDAQPRLPEGRAPDLLGLKLLVGGLGALVILGTALVIGVIIHRLYAKPSPQSMAPAATPAAVTALPALTNRLPARDSIKSIAAAGADLAIWTTGPDGDQILLLNPVTGQLTLAVSK